MKDQELDQFFRESVADYQVIPSKEAWNKVAHQLAPKKRVFGLWIPAVAASILLFGLFIGLWMDHRAQVTYYAANLNQTEKPVVNQVTWIPIIEKPNQSDVAENHSTTNIIEVSAPDKLPAENIAEPTSIQIAWVEPIRKSYPVETWIYTPESSTPWISKTATTSNTIKIKYIAGATLETEAASKNKIGKLIAYAQQTTPADWVGELRDAKDDLLKNRVTLNY